MDEHTFHPAASIFPLMDGDEFDELMESIRANGLRETIKTHEGMILDGRNRLTACRVAGVEPQFELANVNGPAVDYVFDLNYQRRHLTDGAKQLAAGRYKDIAAAEAAERKKATEGRPRKGEKKPVEKLPPVSKARDVAGDRFGVALSFSDKNESFDEDEG